MPTNYIIEECLSIYTSRQGKLKLTESEVNTLDLDY